VRDGGYSAQECKRANISAMEAGFSSAEAKYEGLRARLRVRLRARLRAEAKHDVE